MALRLEWIAIAIAGGIVVLTAFVKFSDQIPEARRSFKELAFAETTLIEVNQKEMIGRAFALSGRREAGVLYLSTLVYQTKQIERLHANEAMLKGEMIYLDGNISFHQQGGFAYQTEHAYYDKQRKILQVTAPFRATLDGNQIEGEQMVYDTQRREINASMVTSSILLSER